MSILSLNKTYSMQLTYAVLNVKEVQRLRLRPLCGVKWLKGLVPADRNAKMTKWRAE